MVEKIERMRKLSREEVLEIIRVAWAQDWRPDLREMDLSKLRFAREDFSSVNFVGAKLKGIYLFKANLRKANFYEGPACQMS